MAVRGALRRSRRSSCWVSAGGSGQVRQRPGNNNHKPICWPETAWPQGPRHPTLRMELIAPTRATDATQARAQKGFWHAATCSHSVFVPVKQCTCYRPPHEMHRYIAGYHCDGSLHGVNMDEVSGGWFVIKWKELSVHSICFFSNAFFFCFIVSDLDFLY